MSRITSHPPLNPLPWIVWALAVPLVAMELTVSLGATGIAGGMGGSDWRFQAIERFAFFPGFLHAAWEQGAIIPAEPWRLVTYAFVHGDFTGALFALVILLALGKMVAEIFRWWAVVVIWLAASIAGAVAFALIPGAVMMPLFGAFPPDYGLIGAFTYLLWMRLAGTGSHQFRAFSLIGLLLLAQLLFGVFFDIGYGWVADIAGFGAGFALSFIVAPGGWRRLRAGLRRRGSGRG